MSHSAPEKRGDPQIPQDLEKTLTHLLEEGRMLLPGIQALFGFQLVAVFNNAFLEHLTSMERLRHVVAVGLIALCMALVLAPVAFHRQVEPHGISESLVTYSTWMMTATQAILMVALCLDFYVVSRLAIGNQTACIWISAALFVFFATLWFLVPWTVRCHPMRPGRGSP